MSEQEVSSLRPPVPRRVIKKRGTTRERTGCLTCRQRKKRCDLGYPVCRECVRLNYKCKWEEPRSVAQDKQSVKSVVPAEDESNSPFRLFNNPDPVLFWVDEHADCTSPSSRRHFLRYYTQTFTHLLTTNIENNSFLSVFLPMAMHSPPLLNTLIAWSSAHLSLRDHSFQQVAIQNRCGALSGLRGALESDPTNIEANLAMSLVLCSLESIMSDNGAAWYQHLVGAAGVISANTSTAVLKGSSTTELLKPFEDAHSGRWLLRNFAYRDIVMAVARDQAPLLSSHHFLRLDEPRLPDSHFGLASEILEIISEITALNEDIKNITLGVQTVTDNNFAFDHHTNSVHEEFERAEILTRFLYIIEIISGDLPKFGTHTPLPLATESVPTQAEGLSSKATAQAAAIVESIEQMPTRSLPECTLLFPIFLAGGEATDESHIKIIRDRMLDMIESRGFRNVQVALSVLEKLWRLRIARKSSSSSNVEGLLGSAWLVGLVPGSNELLEQNTEDLVLLGDVAVEHFASLDVFGELLPVAENARLFLSLPAFE
ncbi:transcriptional regulator family: Fungal Specific TF [Penicillium cosmopolitanum]|uniref:Transcriptional regulator family: Fungal Specific TF n=1 Tax=Penicillium cosmopolitanum TaxID=1131564 RepID=A0A9W9W6T1_9EURO|nr:transcriptional regulator family: Fungal Specific TF [Penicillium cosmopolitanum]KAJ5404480.1 transcriptional regulator family: Fungal Specific TF [Penicillium cosmopolitanum]